MEEIKRLKHKLYYIQNKERLIKYSIAYTKHRYNTDEAFRNKQRQTMRDYISRNKTRLNKNLREYQKIKYWLIKESKNGQTDKSISKLSNFDKLKVSKCYNNLVDKKYINNYTDIHEIRQETQEDTIKREEMEREEMERTQHIIESTEKINAFKQWLIKENIDYDECEVDLILKKLIS